jgi:hypothetical protein
MFTGRQVLSNTWKRSFMQHCVHQLLVAAEKTKPKPPTFESQSETKQLTNRWKVHPADRQDTTEDVHRETSSLKDFKRQLHATLCASTPCCSRENKAKSPYLKLNVEHNSQLTRRWRVHPAGGQDTREGACRETSFLEHMKSQPHATPHESNPCWSAVNTTITSGFESAHLEQNSANKMIKSRSNW